MLLTISELSCSLGSKSILSGVSFELESGSSLVVMGPSGSGKTTLLRCVAGLDPSSGGQVLLQDRAMSSMGYSAWRSALCYLPQKAPALRATARGFLDRVQALKAQSERPTRSAVELTTAWGLDESSWDREFSELSGGEQQRLLLAVAVSRNPAVLLLDEPTSALDRATAALVEESLRGLTTVWVTHDQDQAERVSERRLELPR
jgi:ABC-type multidrug transport system ATPase subunit